MATTQQRITKLETRMDNVETSLAGMDIKLDRIITLSGVAKAGGNFFLDNLPRLVSGIIAGLVAGGVIVQNVN